jgi:hypothetical protein
VRQEVAVQHGRAREAVELEANAHVARGVVREEHVVEVARLHVAGGVVDRGGDLHGVDVQMERMAADARHRPLLHRSHLHRVHGVRVRVRARAKVGARVRVRVGLGLGLG